MEKGRVEEAEDAEALFDRNAELPDGLSRITSTEGAFLLLRNSACARRSSSMGRKRVGVKRVWVVRLDQLTMQTHSIIERVDLVLYLD